MRDTEPYMPALAFDLDDTLYSEADYVRACLMNVAARYSDQYGLEAEELYGLMKQGNPYDIMQELNPETAPTLEDFLHLYRSTYPDGIRLRPDAGAMLENLLNRTPRIPMYLITDGRSTGQRNKIRALGLDRYFDDSHIIISEEIGYDKNTPIPFATAMMRENRPLRWTYVGDNPAKDFRWPNLMGWQTVMAADPDGRNIYRQDSAPAPEYRAACTIHDLTGLSAIIKL